MKKGGPNSPAQIAKKIVGDWVDEHGLLVAHVAGELEDAIVKTVLKERISKLRAVRRLRAHYVKLLLEARDP